MSPTARALADLKEMGFIAQVVERWNAFARRRVDLFNIVDIVALREGVGVLFVQCCAGSSHAARVAKVKAEPRLSTILASGARVEVWSYRKLCVKNKAGKRTKQKWFELRREEIR